MSTYHKSIITIFCVFVAQIKCRIVLLHFSVICLLCVCHAVNFLCVKNLELLLNFETNQCILIHVSPLQDDLLLPIFQLLCLLLSVLEFLVVVLFVFSYLSPLLISSSICNDL